MNQSNFLLLLATPAQTDEWTNVASASLGVSGLAATLLAILIFHTVILGVIGAGLCVGGLILGILGLRRFSRFGSSKRIRRLRRLSTLGIVTSSLVLGGWLLLALLFLLFADPQE